MESLPTDIPSTVLWEAWVQHLFATVPTGTHHGDSGKQGTVAWQVDTQTVGGLEVMTVLEIGILLRVDE